MTVECASAKYMQYSSEPPASFISNADDNISEGKKQKQTETLPKS